MPFSFTCSLLLAGFLVSDAQLFAEKPNFIDQVLQVVWEPSSLIRVWTALDQFYNIGLGWRRAARTLATLPFRQGRSEDHVRIQEPRSSNHRQWDIPHWERFGKIYSGATVRESKPLPRPAFFFHPQEVFLDTDWSQFSALPASGGPREFPRNSNSRLTTRVQGTRDSSVPMFFLGSHSNPETRLRMFVKLMRDLGKVHGRRTNRVTFDDDDIAGGSNRRR